MLLASVLLSFGGGLEGCWVREGGTVGVVVMLVARMWAR